MEVNHKLKQSLFFSWAFWITAKPQQPARATFGVSWPASRFSESDGFSSLRFSREEMKPTLSQKEAWANVRHSSHLIKNTWRFISSLTNLLFHLVSSLDNLYINKLPRSWLINLKAAITAVNFLFSTMQTYWKCEVCPEGGKRGEKYRAAREIYSSTSPFKTATLQINNKRGHCINT